jgi:hypothetical protein
MLDIAQAEIAVVAEFPEQYFLENLAVRADGSILVTALNKKEVWYVPPPKDGLPVQPVLMFGCDLLPLNFVETEPDVFYLSASNVYTTRESHLYRLDLRGWAPGSPVTPKLVLEFPEPKAGLNGSCLLAPGILLVAGATDLIWRVDLPADGGEARAGVWLRHDNMKNRPGEKKPEQPGVNGVRFNRKTGHVYYTSTSQQLMMRVAMDPATYEPDGLPEFIAGGRQWDDFVIDEIAGLAYVTTHRENTIDRVVLEPDGNREGWAVVAGNPFSDKLVGPSSGVWGREPGDYGRRAYFSCDGGTAQPPDGVYRRAKILRIDFPSYAAPTRNGRSALKAESLR